MQTIVEKTPDYEQLIRAISASYCTIPNTAEHGAVIFVFRPADLMMSCVAVGASELWVFVQSFFAVWTNDFTHNIHYNAHKST